MQALIVVAGGTLPAAAAAASVIPAGRAVLD